MSKLRAEVFDRDGHLLTEVTSCKASAFLNGGSAGTFEPYNEEAATLRIYQGDELVASYRTMRPEEYREWERAHERSAP